jgi:hypothetical protein
MSHLGPDMSGLDGYIRYNYQMCLVHLENFFSTLIHELRGTKLDETWTQGSPQHKEQVSIEVFFPKSKDFPSDFG